MMTINYNEGIMTMMKIMTLIVTAITTGTKTVITTMIFIPTTTG